MGRFQMALTDHLTRSQLQVLSRRCRRVVRSAWKPLSSSNSNWFREFRKGAPSGRPFSLDRRERTQLSGTRTKARLLVHNGFQEERLEQHNTIAVCVQTLSLAQRIHFFGISISNHNDLGQRERETCRGLPNRLCRSWNRFRNVVATHQATALVALDTRCSSRFACCGGILAAKVKVSS